ncbi:MAG TPA: antitoxin VapB family protein [Candidatus Deferrimicrobium sp.]|nr:antitoxin VapB family protein [Candidatus Deferrimicrobium sp.]
MTSKIISIRKDIYDHLKRLKKHNESFSEVIERLLTERKKDPLKHFGIAKDLPEEVNNEFEKGIFYARAKNLEYLKKKLNSLEKNSEPNL